MSQIVAERLAHMRRRLSDLCLLELNDRSVTRSD